MAKWAGICFETKSFFSDRIPGKVRKLSKLLKPACPTGKGKQTDKERKQLLLSMTRSSVIWPRVVSHIFILNGCLFYLLLVVFCFLLSGAFWVDRQRSSLTGKGQFHPRFIQIHLCTVQCFGQFLSLIASPLGELQELLGSESLLRVIIRWGGLGVSVLNFFNVGIYREELSQGYEI